MRKQPSTLMLPRGKRWELTHGDALELLASLPAESIDLIVSSPPYCMGKEYEESGNVEDFRSMHQMLFPQLVRVLRNGGSLCWQVGYHVTEGSLMPLDFVVHEVANKQVALHLRNRIVWTFGHGIHCRRRFSGRHETILWYTKGEEYRFNLDEIRVPQKYPGKTYYRGAKKGELSGNPAGKNPSDVWEIPNVKANHVEKTGHPCQFPTALVRRLVRALTNRDGVVLDPFAGSASSGIAALLEARRFIGFELNERYVTLAKRRLTLAAAGKIKVREDMPVFQPTGKEKVAQKPPHFWA